MATDDRLSDAYLPKVILDHTVKIAGKSLTLEFRCGWAGPWYQYDINEDTVGRLSSSVAMALIADTEKP